MKITDFATGLQHIGLPTDRMDETLKFYEELGFTVDHAAKNGEDSVYFLKLGNLVLETYDFKEPAMKSGSIDHIAINVTDIEKVYEMICGKGLNNTNDEIHFLPFYENGVRFFTIEGPGKEKVEFNQFV